MRRIKGGRMERHPFDLNGRVAVVTGGNGGIGLAIALHLAQLGCSIAIWARNANKNASALGQLSAISDRVIALDCDVGRTDQVEAAFAQTLARFGRVDGMITCAGMMGEQKSFLERSGEEFQQILNVNLLGVDRCFRVAARHMRDRAGAGDPFGRLVAISSLAGVEAPAFMEQYGVTKAAVNALVRALAVELARHSITVNSIMPGFAESEMTAGFIDGPVFQKKVLPRVPMRRFGKPDDFAGYAAYLMSDLSGYQTGQSLAIHGGYQFF